ncbi:ketimine reductase mu-crystallin [Bradysia coprophila]|uniref:ketimine reductase mu-crystallin n=1 Tax=Bradysia coprophila TaxID=38358 RepID=UPI00187DC2B5|nr:ketimine reductase mu-crystallin [Bradysia coprophila]
MFANIFHTEIQQRDSQPLYISENEVKKLLSWPLIFEACEQAIRSVSRSESSENQPSAIQPARQRINMNNDTVAVFSMLGVINNYQLPSVGGSKTFNTIGHKMVTSFPKNEQLEPPLPNILASIFLFDTETGRLRSIVEGTEITTWRTAACSLVATKYLYFNRIDDPTTTSVLTIVGCGVQGRIHAIGMCNTFNISTVHLWNRTKAKATILAAELEGVKSTFLNKNLKIFVHDAVDEWVAESDIIVTATSARTPFLSANILKPNVHINAVGAGINHHSELDGSVYGMSKIYVDSWAGAQSELKTLNYPIEGEVGEVINSVKQTPTQKWTIFQSLGMAVEDAAVAQLIVELYEKGKRTEQTVG